MSEFAELHRPGDPLLLPNAWDFGSAAVLVAEGFRAVGTTSLGVALAAGKPDGAAATRDETLALAESLAGLPALVSVDLEGGVQRRPGRGGRAGGAGRCCTGPRCGPSPTPSALFAPGGPIQPRAHRRTRGWPAS